MVELVTPQPLSRHCSCHCPSSADVSTSSCPAIMPRHASNYVQTAVCVRYVGGLSIGAHAGTHRRLRSQWQTSRVRQKDENGSGPGVDAERCRPAARRMLEGGPRCWVADVVFMDSRPSNHRAAWVHATRLQDFTSFDCCRQRQVTSSS